MKSNKNSLRTYTKTRTPNLGYGFEQSGTSQRNKKSQPQSSANRQQLNTSLSITAPWRYITPNRSRVAQTIRRKLRPVGSILFRYAN